MVTDKKIFLYVPDVLGWPAPQLNRVPKGTMPNKGVVI